MCRGGRRGWGRPRSGTLKPTGVVEMSASRQLSPKEKSCSPPQPETWQFAINPGGETELGEPGRIPWSSRNRNQRRRHLAPEFPPRRPTSGVTAKLRARSGRETASPLPHPDDPGAGGSLPGSEGVKDFLDHGCAGPAADPAPASHSA